MEISTQPGERLAILEELVSLDMTEEAERLGSMLVERHAVPEKAKGDSLHIAIACVNRVDYLLTWNCKHIANAESFKLIEQVSEEAGYRSPIICTPEELFGVH